MPVKIARSDPRPSVRVTRDAGSGQHLASVLQEGGENANIDAGLGFIWRISVKWVRMQGRTMREHNRAAFGRAAGWLVIALTALKRGFDAHGMRLGRLSGQAGRPRTPQRAP